MQLRYSRAICLKVITHGSVIHALLYQSVFIQHNTHSTLVLVSLIIVERESAEEQEFLDPKIYY